MWTALAATSVTSSLFLTALAPNLLAIEFIRKATSLDISWMQWFLAAAPAGVILLLALPVLVYVLYPPKLPRVDRRRAGPLASSKPLARSRGSKLRLAALVLLAVFLWIFGGRHLSPTTTALAVVSLMLLCGVLSFDDVVSNHEAWKALIMLATLVTLADGLNRTGFIRWFAEGAAAQMGDLPPTVMVLALVTVYFFAHYLFASITAHVTAMMPIMLSIGIAIPGFPIGRLRAAAGADAWTDGRAHAVRHDIRSSLPRQRLYHLGGVLAPRSHVRRDIPVRPACTERAIRAVEVIGAVDINQGARNSRSRG